MRTYCDIARWQTWVLASTQSKLSEIGINEPKDMLRFPWDEQDEDEEENKAEISDEEVERLRAIIRAENEKNKSKQDEQ